MNTSPTKHRRGGFTLVEIMVAITIIAILAAIAVPSVMSVIARGRNTAIRMEITSLEQAVTQYEQKYGDFPPDGSKWSVLKRHFGRIFPRMSTKDHRLLFQLTHPDGTNFSPVAMDRGEALVFFLGGFSGDEINPLSGPGGPLEYKDTSKPNTDITAYQYNATRDNTLFEFEPDRLTIDLISGVYLSTDENELGFDTLPSGPSTAHNIGDPLPAYRASSDKGSPPLIYFESRSYDSISPYAYPREQVLIGDYNGFATPTEAGDVRPYKSIAGAAPPPYADAQAAFKAFPFKNPKTFQIISPGGDDNFGSIIDTPGGAPVHFIAEDGRAVVPDPSNPFSPGIRGFQEMSAGETENGHLDNVTNFSGTILQYDLED